MGGRFINDGWGHGAGRLVALVLAVLLLATPGISDAPLSEERARAVKAAYLRNFFKFVLWPEASFEHEKSSLIIGVLGDDPIKEVLDVALADKTVNGRDLQARRIPMAGGELPPANRLTACHMLFISASEGERLPAILEVLKGASVMTVSDLENFADDGGMAELLLVGPNIRFRFNRQAAEAAGLRPSSRLLKLAHPDSPSH